MDNLSKDEKRLIVMDTLMTQIMEDITNSNEIDMLKLMTCQQLCVGRTKLISEILGLDVENEEENFDYIESTDYSYRKFLKDKKDNESKISRTHHQTMWN